MDAPFTTIGKILNAAKANESVKLSAYFMDKAMVVIDGIQIPSNEFVGKLIEMPIRHYTYNMLNVLCSDEEATQVVFEMELLLGSEDSIASTSAYYVTATWSNFEDECNVVFVMAAKRK